MNNVYNFISKSRIIPVVKIDDTEKAVKLAKTFVDAGIGIIEITFRSDNALSCIRKIKEEVSDIIVGAGTVLSVKQAKDAIKAGASFVVSPGVDEKVIKFCIKKKIFVLPGVVTPTDIQRCLNFGLDTVKFFPSEAAGGIKTIKALVGPFGGLKFVPTGGISLKNLKEYLSVPSVIACGGTWLAEPELIKNEDFDTIKKIAIDTLSLIREI